ncbi:hypothetical protein ARTHRO8AJ_90051 [Arthrobacter sp. 8AJ]|nr:hypothetical protein ARTHRO8AJ_90051 [Arthrobacter sp. 8AJ]
MPWFEHNRHSRRAGKDRVKVRACIQLFPSLRFYSERVPVHAVGPGRTRKLWKDTPW